MADASCSLWACKTDSQPERCGVLFGSVLLRDLFEAVRFEPPRTATQKCYAHGTGCLVSSVRSNGRCVSMVEQKQGLLFSV
eukprot:2178201-Amphidinium_carterae.1